MKSAAVQTAVVVALAVVASVDAQAVTIRPDLDPATVARLELLERMRASRGIRYFLTTGAMPAPQVVQAAPVTQVVSLPAAPPKPAPSVQVNCVPAAQGAPAVAPPAPAPTQSVAFQQQTVAGSAGTAPAQSLTSRLDPRVMSRSRSATLQSLFDARSLRLYGVAPGTATVTTITPIVTVSQPAPTTAPSQPVCVPAESAKTDGQSTSQSAPPAASPPNTSPSAEPSSQPSSEAGGPGQGGAGSGPGDPGSGSAGTDGSGPDNSGPHDSGPDGSNGSDWGIDEPFAMGGGEPGSGSPFLDPDLIPDLDGSEDGLPPPMQSLAAPPAAVPEPGSLALLGLGLAGLGLARRRRP